MKLTVKINGKTYTRTARLLNVTRANGETYPRKVPFITVNGREYAVERINGEIVCTDWLKLLEMVEMAQLQRQA